jgi:capsular polysaccharide biosynthesis protein
VVPELSDHRPENGPSAWAGFPDEVDLSQFVLGLWRRRWLIVAMTMIGAVGSLLVTISKTPMYETTVKVLVPSLEMAPGAQLTASAFGAIVQGPGVASVVVREFRLDTPPFGLTIDDFRKTRMSVSAVSDASIAHVTVRLEDPDKAAQVANRVAELSVARVQELCNKGRVKQYEAMHALLEETKKRLDAVEKRMDAIVNGPDRNAPAGDPRSEWQRLTLEVEMLRARLAYVDLTTRIEDVNSRPVRSLSQLGIVDRALPPSRAAETNPLRRTVAGGVLGYLVSVVGILLFDALRLTVLRQRS